MIVRNVRRAATTALVLLSAAGALAAAHGDTNLYVSPRCPDNPDGMIYLAAGRHVFQQPPQNLSYVHEMSSETATGLPVPPRAFEPRGCPNHPMRGAVFTFSAFSDVDKPGSVNARFGGSVQIIDIDPASALALTGRWVPRWLTRSRPRAPPAGDGLVPHAPPVHDRRGRLRADGAG